MLKTFGSLPEDQDGKKLTGVKFGIPKLGDVRLSLHGTWLEMTSETITTSRPIAIYKATHREDGTPMETAELPVVEGYRVEYFGKGMVSDDMGEACGFAYWAPANKFWRVCESDKHPLGASSYGHYARLFKIAQPTTPADLVGEDGQKIVWLHWESSGCENGTAASSVQILVNSNGINVDGESIEYIISKDYRWSHRPTTAYADATPFKGGNNE